MSIYLPSSSIERMRNEAYNVYGFDNIADWLCKHTLINDKKFSFKDREFQLAILQDTCKDQIVVKCAQVGLSELSYRWAVATTNIFDNFTVIYTFPTAGDAIKNNKTRIGPMIEASPTLKANVNPDLNNSEIIQFRKNSFIFFKGTMAETAALSTPADALIHDEMDKSDMDVLTTYRSRLQDKPTKIRKVFSTPTVANYGVDKEARTARRFYHFIKCNCCGHTFLPSYYDHVKIPGWNKSLEEITKDMLDKVRWKEAILLCPHCGKDPEMHYTRMPWVCENPDQDYPSNAWFVSPFSAHKRILTPQLVRDSTEYKKISEFKNQALGLVAEDKQESLTVDDIDRMQMQPVAKSSEIHQMGIDYGITCHIVVGRQLATGEIVVVHRERCHYSQVEMREAQLRIEYMVTTGVNDSQPYSDIVNRLCARNENAWGAVYVSSKGTNLFTVREQPEEPEEGKLGFRIVNINRNVAFDELMAIIKSGSMIISKSDENDLFRKHMLSMKRVQKITNDGEFKYVWAKAGDEQDHYHHALLYFFIAVKMRHTAGIPGLASAGVAPVIVVRKDKRRLSGGDNNPFR